MADEIRFTKVFNIHNGNFRDQISADGTIDQAVLALEDGIVFVGTSEEDMLIGDVVTNGLLILQNLDDTNFVTFGPKSGGVMVPLGRVNPGECPDFRLEPGVTLRWKADTAMVKMRMYLLND